MVRSPGWVNDAAETAVYHHRLGCCFTSWKFEGDSFVYRGVGERVWDLLIDVQCDRTNGVMESNDDRRGGGGLNASNLNLSLSNVSNKRMGGKICITKIYWNWTPVVATCL